MSPRLKISSCVIERLSKIKTYESTGCLYGLMYDGTLLVVGMSLELFENEKNTYHQLLLNLPAEIELCGVVKFGENVTTGTTTKDILQDVDITDNPLVIIVNKSKEMKAHFMVHEKFEETSYEVMSKEEMWKQFLHVRLNTVLPLSVEATIAGVKNMLQNKRKKIASGQVSFHIDGTSVYLFGVDSDVGLTGTSTEATIGELLDSMSPEQPKKKKHNTNVIEVKQSVKEYLFCRLTKILNSLLSGGNKVRAFNGWVMPQLIYSFGILRWTQTELDALDRKDIVPVNFVMKATKDILSEKLVKTAVKMMTTQRKPSFCISMPLKIDTLAMIHRSTKLLDLYTVLVEAACRSLRLLESVLLEQLGQEGIGDGAGIRLPETYHYLPQELGHFLTRVVPKDIPDESMEKERRMLHEQLSLPSDRPIFRRGNAYPGPSARLINPHEAIPYSPGKDTQAAFVRGRYEYYHYMQDNFNDDGWGCAYRSMQTIFSWFRYQGYSTEKVPTHREVQACLVALGDKPSSFIGSRQWIGSTEVMFCLEALFGASSKIIFANTGQDLLSYSPDIYYHFEIHGTPIMIGGGVLAHTILGIEYNPETNDTRYLILDPHYTGSEDLSVVVGKGWCGWKTSDFWNKAAHYNLCLPMTKHAV